MSQNVCQYCGQYHQPSSECRVVESPASSGTATKCGERLTRWEPHKYCQRPKGHDYAHSELGLPETSTSAACPKCGGSYKFSVRLADMCGDDWHRDYLAVSASPAAPPEMIVPEEYVCKKCGFPVDSPNHNLGCVGVASPAAPLKDGEPCSHPGCLAHTSHPCEGCGRINGKGTINVSYGIRVASPAAPQDWRNIVTGACQILDVVKGEWKESWSDWDQSIRDGLSEMLQKSEEPS